MVRCAHLQRTRTRDGWWCSECGVRLLGEFVARAQSGNPVGETHHLARICEDDIRRMRDLYERDDWTMPRIAATFGVSYNTVISILCYRRRTERPVRWLEVQHATQEQAEQEA